MLFKYETRMQLLPEYLTDIRAIFVNNIQISDKNPMLTRQFDWSENRLILD